jgi:hypothetical protein
LTGAFRKGALDFPSTQFLAAVFLGAVFGAVLEAAVLAAGFLLLGADLVLPAAFFSAVLLAGAFSGLVLGS